MPEQIRPRDLAFGTPNANADLLFDSGVSVLRTNPLAVVDAARPIASQAEAESGLDNAKIVTPLRVAQAIQASPTIARSKGITDKFSIAGEALVLGSDITVVLDDDGNTLFQIDTNGVSYKGTLLQGRSVELDATYFGLKADGSSNNMVSFRLWMAAASVISAAGGRPIMRASGTFRCVVDTTHGSIFGERKAIRASAVHNAHWDCAAATWLFDSGDVNTGIANVINIEDSDNLTGNLGSIDWLRLPYAQGAITKGANYLDIALPAGFTPTFNQVQRVEVYDGAKVNQSQILSKDFSGGSDVAGWPVTYPSSSVMRVSFVGSSEGLAYLASLTNGDVVVATFRVYGGDGFRLIRCRNADLKAHVTATGGMAFRANEPEDCRLAVSVGASPGRLVAATADGIHCAAGRGYLEVIGSVRNTGDDPLNVTNDSYVVTSVSSPRTFVISSGYPNIVPRVGDRLSGVNDAGAATALGQVVTINPNSGLIVMDTDLPAGFATTWQVVDTSACPVVTFPETFIAEKCRGNVRSQVPSLCGRIRASDLTGSVTVEYIPYFTGEGTPPNATSLDVESTRCNTSRINAGAVMAQAYQIDGGGYADAGAVSKPVINAVVRETNGSALFLAGVSYGCGTLVTDRCCLNPNTSVFALSDKQLAMINCDNINFPSLTELGATPGQIGTSGTTTNIRYGSKLNYA